MLKEIFTNNSKDIKFCEKLVKKQLSLIFLKKEKNFAQKSIFTALNSFIDRISNKISKTFEIQKNIKKYSSKDLNKYINLISTKS